MEDKTNVTVLAIREILDLATTEIKNGNHEAAKICLRSIQYYLNFRYRPYGFVSYRQIAFGQPN